MTLEQFNKQYKYKTDKDKFGFLEVWDIPTLQDDGFYCGDCEDYAIFLKKIGWFTIFSKFVFGKIISTIKGK